MNFYKLFFIFLSLIISYFLKSAKAITSASVDVNPNTMSSTSVLSVKFIPGANIQQNGKVRVNIPPQASISTGALTCAMQGFSISLTCQATSNRVIQITVTQAGGFSSPLFFNVQIQGFQNPPTTQTTAVFQYIIFNAAGAEVERTSSSNNSLKITLDPGTFRSAQINPTSTFVVGQTGPARLTFVANHQVPQNGQISLKLPKWNPNAAVADLQTIVENPLTVQCTAGSNVAASVTCSYDTSTDTLTVSNGFQSGAIPAGQTVIVNILNLRNPRSTGGLTSGITLKTLTSSGNTVDQSTSVAFTGITTPAPITLPTVANVVSNVVDFLGTFSLGFYVPVYVDQGCQMEITFPDEIQIDQATLTGIQGSGVFRDTISTFQLHQPTVKQITLRDACNVQSKIGLSGLVFRLVRNPRTTAQTKTFQLLLKAGTTNQIASLTTGMTFTATKNVIQSISLSPSSTKVSENTRYTITFAPTTRLLPDSQLRIQFPVNQFQLVTGSCPSLTNLLGGVSDSRLTCQIDATTSTLILKNLFTSQYTFSSSVTPSFTIPVSGASFGKISNPPTTASMSSLTFQTRVPASTGANLVDQGVYTPAFTLTANQIAASSVRPVSLRTNDLTQYEITIQSTGVYPQGVVFTITFPIQISSPNLSNLSSSCTNVQNIPSLTCSSVLDAGKVKVQVSSKWTSSQAAGLIYKFKFAGSVLQNPRTTATTSQFAISIGTATGSIEQTTNGPAVTMTSVPSFTSATVSNSNSYNSALNTYTFRMTTPIELLDNDLIKLSPPAQVTSPPTPVCTGTTNLQSSLTCTKSGDSVVITLNFPALQGDKLSANQSIEVTITNYKNPPSTAVSGSFVLTALQNTGLLLDYPTNNLTVQTVAPASIPSSSVSISLSSTVPRQVAAYTFRFANTGQIPAGGMIRLIYPSTVTITSLPLCKGDGSPLPLTVSCDHLSASRQINIKNGFTNIFHPGIVTFIIESITNASTVADSNRQSFQIFTYSDTSATISIDSALTGLLPAVTCDFPCETCTNVATPTQCLSCIPSTNFYLQAQTCVSSCGDGFIANPDPAVKTCLPCTSPCSKCQTSVTQCTECIAGHGLLNSACYNPCPDGYFLNGNICTQCTSPCFTCTNANFCTACLQNQAKIFLQSTTGVCSATCPAGTVASGSSCLDCTAPCSQCTINQTTCTGCISGHFLYQNACLATCPANVTVPNTTNSTCQACDGNCATCSGTTTNCLSCPTNRFLRGHQCVTSCTNGTQVAINNVCTPCSLNCSKCETSVSNCVQCASSLFLHQGTCVAKCPNGYVGINNTHCVIGAVICPQNYVLNSDGSACNLSCATGYEANSTGTDCIVTCVAPAVRSATDSNTCVNIEAQRTLFYFPFLITGLCLVIFTAIGRRCAKRSLFLTNAIVLLGFLQCGALGMQTYLTYDDENDEGLTFMLLISLGALAGLFICNVLFGLIYCTSINQNQIFKQWKKKSKCNRCTSGVIATLSITLNFKSMRLFYAQFFGMRQCYAQFTSRKIILRPMFCLSFFSLIITTVPIIIIDFLGFLWYFDWGRTQLSIMMIQTFVLECFMIILVIAEAVSLPKISDDQDDDDDATLLEKPYDKFGSKDGMQGRSRGGSRGLDENSFSSLIGMGDRSQLQESASSWAGKSRLRKNMSQSDQNVKLKSQNSFLMRQQENNKIDLANQISKENNIKPVEPLLDPFTFQQNEQLNRSKSHQNLRQGVIELIDDSDSQDAEQDFAGRISFPTTPKRYRQLKYQQSFQQQLEQELAKFNPYTAPDNVYAQSRDPVKSKFQIQDQANQDFNDFQREEQKFNDQNLILFNQNQLNMQAYRSAGLVNAQTQTPKKKGGSTLSSLKQGISQYNQPRRSSMFSVTGFSQKLQPIGQADDKSQTSSSHSPKLDQIDNGEGQVLDLPIFMVDQSVNQHRRSLKSLKRYKKMMKKMKKEKKNNVETNQSQPTTTSNKRDSLLPKQFVNSQSIQNQSENENFQPFEYQNPSQIQKMNSKQIQNSNSMQDDSNNNQNNNFIYKTPQPIIDAYQIQQFNFQNDTSDVNQGTATQSTSLLPTINNPDVSPIQRMQSLRSFQYALESDPLVKGNSQKKLDKLNSPSNAGVVQKAQNPIIFHNFVSPTIQLEDSQQEKDIKNKSPSAISLPQQSSEAKSQSSQDQSQASSQKNKDQPQMLDFEQPNPNKELNSPLTAEEIQLNIHPSMPAPPHLFVDVQQMKGTFHKDVQGTNIITKNRKGFMVDKFGRIVNALGYLSDRNGHLLVSDGMLDAQGLGGGTSYAPNCWGQFDENEEGELVLQRDFNSKQFTDKWGRAVNQQGYLIDLNSGNIITAEGQVIAMRGDLGQSWRGPTKNPKIRHENDSVLVVKGDIGQQEDEGPGMVVQDKSGNIFDIRGRRINEKGFLIDCQGNILNGYNQIGFMKYDLDIQNQFPMLIDIAQHNYQEEEEEEEQQQPAKEEEQEKLMKDIQSNFSGDAKQMRPVMLNKLKQQLAHSRAKLHQRSSAQIIPKANKFSQQGSPKNIESLNIRDSRNSVTKMLEKELSRIKSKSNDLLPLFPTINQSSNQQLEPLNQAGTSVQSLMEVSPTQFNDQNQRAKPNAANNKAKDQKYSPLKPQIKNSSIKLNTMRSGSSLQTSPAKNFQSGNKNKQSNGQITFNSKYSTNPTTTMGRGSTTRQFPSNMASAKHIANKSQQNLPHSIQQEQRQSRANETFTPYNQLMTIPARNKMQQARFNSTSPNYTTSQSGGFYSSDTSYQAQYQIKQIAGGIRHIQPIKKKIDTQNRRQFRPQHNSRVVPGQQSPFPNNPPIHRMLKKDHSSSKRSFRSNSQTASNMSLMKLTDNISRIGGVNQMKHQKSTSRPFLLSQVVAGGGTGRSSSKKLIDHSINNNHNSRGMLLDGNNVLINESILQPTTPNTKNHFRQIQLKQMKIQQIREKFAKDGSLKKLYDPSEPSSSSGDNRGAAILKPNDYQQSYHHQNNYSSNPKNKYISPLRAAGGGFVSNKYKTISGSKQRLNNRSVQPQRIPFNQSRLKGLQTIYLAKLQRPNQLSNNPEHQRSQSTMNNVQTFNRANNNNSNNNVNSRVSLRRNSGLKSSRATLLGSKLVNSKAFLQSHKQQQQDLQNKFRMPRAKKMANYVQSFTKSFYNAGSQDAMYATGQTPSPVKQQNQRVDRQNMIQNQRSGARLPQRGFSLDDEEGDDEFLRLMKQNLKNYGDSAIPRQENYRNGVKTQRKAQIARQTSKSDLYTRRENEVQMMTGGGRKDSFSHTQQGRGQNQAKVYNWIKQ